MLSITTILEVRRLLAAGGRSQRAIATQVGVSRGIVALIAAGRRHLHSAEPNCKSPLRRSRAGTTRCPGCGGLVYLPCLLCRARQLRRRQQLVAEPRGDRPNHSHRVA